MSVSAIFGTRIALAPPVGINGGGGKSVKLQPSSGGVVIECSSRPQKKATAHHMKTRPKKTQPWDVRRRPTVYPPLPPLPPDWTFVSAGSDEADSSSTADSSAPSAE
ncbi:unnamed protein product [Amaranthus hypochondriacus]